LEKFNKSLIEARFRILLGQLEEHDEQAAMDSTDGLIENLKDDPEGWDTHIRGLRGVKAAMKSHGPMYAARMLRKTLGDTGRRTTPKSDATEG
jgi:hypothetical protein